MSSANHKIRIGHNLCHIRIIAGRPQYPIDHIEQDEHEWKHAARYEIGTHCSIGDGGVGAYEFVAAHEHRKRTRRMVFGVLELVCKFLKTIEVDNIDFRRLGRLQKCNGRR